jgi:hypothetical protein
MKERTTMCDAITEISIEALAIVSGGGKSKKFWGEVGSGELAAETSDGRLRITTRKNEMVCPENGHCFQISKPYTYFLNGPRQRQH